MNISSIVSVGTNETNLFFCHSSPVNISALKFSGHSIKITSSLIAAHTGASYSVKQTGINIFCPDRFEGAHYCSFENYDRVGPSVFCQKVCLISTLFNTC